MLWALLLIGVTVPVCSWRSAVCPNQNLKCKHGTTLDYTAAGCDPGPTQCRLSDPAWWYFNKSDGCDCNTTFMGSECQFDNPVVCPRGSFDGDVLPYPGRFRELECAVDLQAMIAVGFDSILNLVNHRVIVTTTNNGSFTFSVLTRDVQQTPDPTNATFSICGGMFEAVACNCTECVAQSLSGNRMQISCQKPNCTAASETTRELLAGVKPPLSVIFSNMVPTKGTSNFGITIALGVLDLTLSGQCLTGECQRNDTVTPAKPILPQAYEAPLPDIAPILIPLGICVAVALCLCCLFLIWLRVPSRQPVKQRQPEDDEMLGESTTTGLVWEGVQYSIPVADGRRPILRGVSGFIRPHEMVAILGPSGAGKSSLLDILAERRVCEGGKISLTENNHPILARRKDVIRYVTQTDEMMETQTVRETLMFSALLRSKHPDTTAKVDAVLSKLSITNIANSIIGNADVGGISGGERKRVAIGAELVTDPRVLMLDEPTSGLDSYSVEMLGRVLRAICKTGCPCLFTIHQATSSFFSQLDKVLVLTAHGRLSYFGPPSGVRPYFENVGRQFPSDTNPAEFLLEVLHERHDGKVEAIEESWARSTLRRDMDDEVGVIMTKARTHGEFAPHYARNCCYQLYWLTRRQGRHLARNLTLLLTTFLATALIAALVGAIFFKLDNKIPGMQNRLGMLFFLCIFFSLTSMSSLGVFVVQRRLYWRESQAGYYSALPYYLAQYCCDIIPLRILPPALFALICYPMVGLQRYYDKLGIFILTLVLMSITATAACLCISAVSSSIAQANFIAVIFFIFCMVFGGLFLSNDTYQGTDFNVRYLSFMNYAYEALTGNEFQGLPMVFNPKGLPEVNIKGETLLVNFGLYAANMESDLIYLACFWAGFTILGFLFFLTCNRTPSRSRSYYLCQRSYAKTHANVKRTDGEAAELAPLAVHVTREMSNSLSMGEEKGVEGS